MTQMRLGGVLQLHFESGKYKSNDGKTRKNRTVEIKNIETFGGSGLSSMGWGLFPDSISDEKFKEECAKAFKKDFGVNEVIWV